VARHSSLVRAIIEAQSPTTNIISLDLNMVAHGLAKAILFENDRFYCLETGPDWLQKSINDDLVACNV
jgi:precorrin isomerase